MFFFSFQMRKKWSRGPSARDWANISFGKQRKSNPAYGGSWGLSGILSASACHHWTPELMPALINIIHHTINVLWLVNVCIQRCIQYLLISWILIKKDIRRFLSISLMSVKFTWDIPDVELDIFLQFLSSKELFFSIILVLYKVSCMFWNRFKILNL